MTRFIPIGGKNARILISPLEVPGQAKLLQGTGCNVRMRLNGRLMLYAARVMTAAIEADDFELVSIIEYALYGVPSTSIRMEELAPRLISLQKRAREKRDKKMQLVLKAAAANSAG